MAVDEVAAESLLSQMTLDEKLTLMAGGSTWRTAGIDRLCVPSLKFSDGPSGARGEIFGESVPAAFLPSGVSLGATWDVELLYEVGQCLAEQCKTRSASVILAPTMCIHRHPLGGRNFESFSEDPFLTGKLATAHVRGVQSRGIGATPKHFVANDQETNRFHYSANIQPRALHEVYLRPFQMVVRDANPWCMMTAYNRVNGYHCDSSKVLLTDIARGDWGWDGVFLSDWGGTNSCEESINAGLDLEMPGPPVKRSRAALTDPLKHGRIDLKCVDDSVSRMLRLLQKANRFADPRDDPEFCHDDSDSRDLLLRAASAGIVMLKNAGGALPLKPEEQLKKIAIVGPNAMRVVAGGGGSSYIKAPYWTDVLSSVKREFQGTPTEIVTAVGAKVNRYVPSMPSTVATNPDTGAPGAAVDWFVGHDLTSKVVVTTHTDDLYYMTFGQTPSEITRETGFAYRLRTTLRPLTSGNHKMSFASIGPSELYVDDSLVSSRSGSFEEKGTLFFTYGHDEDIFYMNLEAGRDYTIRVDYRSHDRQLREDLLPRMDPMEDKFQGVRIGYEEFGISDFPKEAAALATDCDAAIVVVGRDKEWETEGQDIPLFELPGEQVRLIREVAAATLSKRTIVIVQAGTPVDTSSWISEVQGVLYTWYQGQELGNAAAAILCGKFNPSGRLPMTYPNRIEECPGHASFPGEQGESYYSEGLFVGYKWWDLTGIKPQFPIGFGLAFNDFEISAVSISSTTLKEDVPVILSIKIRNIGGSELPGRETVIAWHSQRSPIRLVRPEKEICGFGKSRALTPGEEDVVYIEVTSHSLGMFDTARGAWVIDADSRFDILLGTNASNAVAAWEIIAPKEITWTL